MALEGGVVMPS